MSRTLRSLIILAAIPIVLAYGGCERLFLKKGFPRIDGTFDAMPVTQRVEIVRDEFGIPHIFAQNEFDLMTALGVVHAQDRLWQMETFRRIAVGRLAEVAGPEAVEMDHWARLIGLPALRQSLADRLDAGQRERAEAYVAGINAVIERKGGDLPLEFQSLGIRPAPWTVADVFAVPAFNTWMLQTNFPQEWLALAAREHLDLAALRDLFPSMDGPPPPEDAYYENLRHLRIGSLLPAMESLYRLRGSDAGASNNWVTADGPGGKPLFSGDPHLGLMVPGVWYFCHLSLPGRNVAGASLAGVPGIVIGHNDRVAWSWTNTMADIVDLYVLRLDPNDHGRYLADGESLPFETRVETIRVSGGEEVRRTIRSTVHGPVITADCDTCNAVAALKWLGNADPDLVDDRGGVGLWALNGARSVDEAFDAASHFKMQSQNLVAADVEGNIGWHVFGAVPVRRGYSGRLPADGSNGGAGWSDFIPYDELPHDKNPARGWIATANNRTVDDKYPHTITHAWCSPYRFLRIKQMIEKLDGPTPADFARMQLDVHSLQADRILGAVPFDAHSDARAKKAARILREWDREVRADSAGAAVWNVFLVQFAEALVGDELSEHMRWYLRLLAASPLFHDVAFDRPESPLWDNVNTPGKETPADVVESALVAAHDTLVDRLGADETKWRWGGLHTYHFAHPGAKKWYEHRLLSRGPYPAPGDNTTVNVAVHVPEGDEFGVVVLPSLRMIAPLNDLSKTTIVGPIGQSGQPGHPHYDDMLGPWLSAKGVPLRTSREDIEKHAAHRLLILPMRRPPLERRETPR